MLQAFRMDVQQPLYKDNSKNMHLPGTTILQTHSHFCPTLIFVLKNFGHFVLYGCMRNEKLNGSNFCV